jgi:hypothetical protein
MVGGTCTAHVDTVVDVRLRIGTPAASLAWAAEAIPIVLDERLPARRVDGVTGTGLDDAGAEVADLLGWLLADDAATVVGTRAGRRLTGGGAPPDDMRAGATTVLPVLGGAPGAGSTWRVGPPDHMACGKSAHVAPTLLWSRPPLLPLLGDASGWLRRVRRLDVRLVGSEVVVHGRVADLRAGQDGVWTPLYDGEFAAWFSMDGGLTELALLPRRVWAPCLEVTEELRGLLGCEPVELAPRQPAFDAALAALDGACAYVRTIMVGLVDVARAVGLLHRAGVLPVA